MKEEPDDCTRLEYLLNFLGTTGQWKHEQWKPKGATEADHENKKKSTTAFLEYISSTMDHACVSMMQNLSAGRCLYTWTGETPDDLVECIHRLCQPMWFPLQWREGKESTISFCPCPIWFRPCLQTPCPKVNSQQLLRCWNYATHTLPSQTTWKLQA